MAELEQFRVWVEARQKRTRQLILAERDSENLDRNWLENWAEAMTGTGRRDPLRLSSRGVAPKSDPMWDEDLDG